MNRCIICSKVLTNRETPWTLCYDPAYKRNVWGGDTYEVKGELCPMCATHLLLVAKSHKDALRSEYEEGRVGGFTTCDGGGELWRK